MEKSAGINQGILTADRDRIMTEVVHLIKNWKEIVLAFFMCAVLPSIIFAVLPGLPEMNRDETIETNPSGEDTVHTNPASEPSEEDDNNAQPQSVFVVIEDGSVISMNMDDYLTGVILKEMPAQFDLEAMKAQAVVARTYALRRMELADKHSSGAVCVDPSCCQAYCSEIRFLADGGTEASIRKVKQAVSETKDLVITYGGAMIEATYLSCSGGRTEDAQAVWGSDIPYLQSVDSPGEETALHYTDTVTFTSEEFASLLGQTFSGHPATWVESVTYTAGGGVDTMVICGKSFDGTTLRTLLGLRSTVFILTAVGNKIIITTKGFGHRVGMSQYGAEAMAVGGYSFDQILSHYYQGIQLISYHQVKN